MVKVEAGVDIYVLLIYLLYKNCCGYEVLFKVLLIQNGLKT